MEVAKDYRQKDDDSKGIYSPESGYFINQRMYDYCLEEVSIDNLNNEDK